MSSAFVSADQQRRELEQRICTLKSQAMIDCNGQPLAYQHDKRLNDLRAFALEYVKLIVSKASEISSQAERQELKGQQEHKFTHFNIINVRQGQTNELDPSRKVELSKVIRKAANQINHQFQLEQDCSRGPQIDESVNKQNWVDRHGEADSANRGVSGSPSGAQGASSSSGKRRTRFGGKHLNWHLLVSCFSTCLPRTLIETIPSGLGSRTSEDCRASMRSS